MVRIQDVGLLFMARLSINNSVDRWIMLFVVSKPATVWTPAEGVLSFEL